jgi:hypothetical protein
MENWWIYVAMGNTKYSEKNLLHVTGTSLDSSSDLRGEKSEADHLKRGKATYDYRDIGVEGTLSLRWVTEKLYIRFLKILNSCRIGSRSRFCENSNESSSALKP